MVPERLLPNLVFIDEPGYAAMCIDALKIVSTTAGTDFGSCGKGILVSNGRT